jgi:hypothetical protein
VWRQGQKFLAAIADATACRIEQSCQGAQGAALAGTIRTDQSHHLAFIDMKGNAANGLDTTVGNAQSVNFEHDSSLLQATEPPR